MEVVCTLAAVLLVVLAVVMLIAALVRIAVALEGADNSPHERVRKSMAEIEQISYSSRQAMDNLSEQYLDELFRQVTDRPQQR